MFYDHFLKLCYDRDMAPTAVIKAIGLSKSNVTYWKNGAVPSTRNLQKLADYFNIPLYHLLEARESSEGSTAQSFCDRFLALCKTCGKTPSAVLKEIGLTRMNASLWKKGSMPSSTNLQKLADYFSVPTDYLLGTSKTITNAAGHTNTQNTIAEAEIEKDKIHLKNLIDSADTITKDNRAKAIQEITAFTQYTLDKYRSEQPQNP